MYKALATAILTFNFMHAIPVMAAATADVVKDSVAEEAVKDAEALTAPATEATTMLKADVSVKNLKESEIPVHLEAAKKESSGEGSFYKILAALGVLGIMACGAYFLIRKYKQTAGKTAQATQIKVLTQHYLGPKKSLAIIRVAGESILVGITDQNINMIKSLSLLDEDIPEELPKTFGNVFAGTQRKQAVADARMQAQEASEDDFAISGIKDFVSSKLKNMRTLE